MRAGDAQADGLVGDALVVAGQARRLRHNLLPDTLVVEEPLARAVQEPAGEAAQAIRTTATTFQGLTSALD